MLGVVRHSSHAAAGSRALLRSAAVSQPGVLKFDANYETVINKYFTDVAHDSGGTSNVYSAATQYSDGTGPIQYQSTFGGSYVDHDPLPTSGCNDSVNPACLTDNQLRHEIQRVLTATGWHGSSSTMFFLMTPNGVGTCYDSLPDQCSANFFCAYHDSFVDSNNEPVIYANEPYQPAIDACASGSSPNGDGADTTINTISHEHNEAITDPFGDAWYANDPELRRERRPLRLELRRDARRDRRHVVQPGDQRRPLLAPAGVQQRRQRLCPVPRWDSVADRPGRRQRAARLPPDRPSDAHEHDVRDLLASYRPPRGDGVAAHQGPSPGRKQAFGQPRFVDVLSDGLPLPVAPLQRARWELLEHPSCDAARRTSSRAPTPDTGCACGSPLPTPPGAGWPSRRQARA